MNLEPADFVAFVAASFLGFFAGALVPDPMWSVYVSTLLSYHLFLLWLVLSGEQKAGISLSLGSTLVTHLACLILIVPVGMARNLAATSASSASASPGSRSSSAVGCSAPATRSPNARR